MKKISLLLFTLAISMVINAQIQVISSGNVGIGTTASSSYKFNLSGSSYFGGGVTSINDGLMLSTSLYGPTSYILANSSFPGLVLNSGNSYNSTYMLWVGGDCYSSGSWISSDFELKKNVALLSGEQMLLKIKNLDGKKYEFKSKQEIDQIYKNGDIEKFDSYKLNNLPKGERFGFIAQELELVFPELIKTDSITGLKAIDYDGMIPVLLQCIKEQQKQIEALNNSITYIKNSNDFLPSLKNVGSVKSLNEKESVLEQNIPNPFNTSTEIRYYIPDNFNRAYLHIFDMQGTLLKTILIIKSGNGSIIINAYELKAGMYIYSLVVDDKEVDTKRMIITE